MPTLRPITFDRFVSEDLFSLMGLESLDQKSKEEIVEAMNQTVMARVYSKIYADMDPEKRAHLDSLSVEEMVPYLSELGIDIAQMLIDEATQYRIEVVKMYESILAPMQSVQKPLAAA